MHDTQKQDGCNTYYKFKEKIERPHHAFQDILISRIFSNSKQK